MKFRCGFGETPLNCFTHLSGRRPRGSFPLPPLPMGRDWLHIVCHPMPGQRLFSPVPRVFQAALPDRSSPSVLPPPKGPRYSCWREYEDRRGQRHSYTLLMEKKRTIVLVCSLFFPSIRISPVFLLSCWSSGCPMPTPSAKNALPAVPALHARQRDPFSPAFFPWFSSRFRRNAECTVAIQSDRSAIFSRELWPTDFAHLPQIRGFSFSPTRRIFC